MAKIAIIGCVVVLMMMVMVALNAEGAITCETVVESLTPCSTYLTQGGSVPAQCCSGVRSLNNEASTTADRQTACNCLKTAAKELNVNPSYAASLPSDCDVNLGYPISYNTNCATVK